MQPNPTEPIHPLLAEARCEFGPGWKPLVLATCEVFQSHLDSTPECPPVRVGVVKTRCQEQARGER